MSELPVDFETMSFPWSGIVFHHPWASLVKDGYKFIEGRKGGHQAFKWILSRSSSSSSVIPPLNVYITICSGVKSDQSFVDAFAYSGDYPGSCLVGFAKLQEIESDDLESESFKDEISMYNLDTPTKFYKFVDVKKCKESVPLSSFHHVHPQPTPFYFSCADFQRLMKIFRSCKSPLDEPRATATYPTDLTEKIDVSSFSEPKKNTVADDEEICEMCRGRDRVKKSGSIGSGASMLRKKRKRADMDETEVPDEKEEDRQDDGQDGGQDETEAHRMNESEIVRLTETDEIKDALLPYDDDVKKSELKNVDELRNGRRAVGEYQVDETLICLKRTSLNRFGRQVRRPSRWVFGVIDTDNDWVYISSVRTRSMASLHRHIRYVIPRGSTITSDRWRGYNRLTRRGYRHFHVNHRHGFVNRVNVRRNTNAIECLWSHLKCHLRYQRGFRWSDRLLHLNEFTWKYNRRRLRRHGWFLLLLCALSRFH